VDVQGRALSASQISDAAGGYSVLVPPDAGGFLMQVGPPADADGGLPLDPLPSYPPQPYANPLPLPLPPVAALDVNVLDPTGAHCSVLATRLANALVPTRTAFTTPTDGYGVFRLVADAGNWRFEIVPTAGTALPRAIVGVVLDGADLGESEMGPLLISNALHV